MFSSALFFRGTIWKLTRCPQTKEQKVTNNEAMAHYNDCSATYSITMSMDLACYVQEQQPQTRGHACRNHCHQVQSQIQGKQDHDSGEKVQPLAKNLLRVKFSVSRCSFCENSSSGNTAISILLYVLFQQNFITKKTHMQSP